MPGIVIGAPRSGSGKTTLTLGLLRALRRRGVAVAPFKCGPDYIDTAFHRAAAGRDSINLDAWAMPPDLLATLVRANMPGAAIAVAEGLMGFFDGVPAPPGRTGSSADVAAALGWPLVLVLDIGGQAQTAAALAQGFARYDARVPLAGVVLNKVGSERHRRLATDAITACGIPVLGALPRNDAIALPERHLGLVQAHETSELDAKLDAIAEFVAAHVDIDAVLQAAPQKLSASESRTRHKLASADHNSGREQRAPECTASRIAPPAQRIAIAKDAAFSFLYPHLLAAWRSAGAELTFFSPLADEAPPAHCDLCWLPGGYPELHAGRLAGNARFLNGLRTFANDKMVHGECGGYMVLGESLVDAAGARHAMANLLPLDTSFASRKLHLGYREATLSRDGPLGATGTVLRGHEFHYATILREEGEPFATVQDAHGSAPVRAGLRSGTVSGSFFHLIAAQ